MRSRACVWTSLCFDLSCFSKDLHTFHGLACKVQVQVMRQIDRCSWLTWVTALIPELRSCRFKHQAGTWHGLGIQILPPLIIWLAHPLFSLFGALCSVSQRYECFSNQIVFFLNSIELIGLNFHQKRASFKFDSIRFREIIYLFCKIWQCSQTSDVKVDLVLEDQSMTRMKVLSWLMVSFSHVSCLNC